MSGVRQRQQHRITPPNGMAGQSDAGGIVCLASRHECLTDQKVIMRPVSVVVRQSTDIYHLDDPEVLRALEFMKKNFDKPIQVDDVVEATHISRRALYSRFENTLGRSVSEELRRIRVEHLARILVETSLPISRIIDNCEYTSSRNVARYFRQEKGMSLFEYRRKFSGQI